MDIKHEPETIPSGTVIGIIHSDEYTLSRLIDKPQLSKKVPGDTVTPSHESIKEPSKPSDTSVMVKPHMRSPPAVTREVEHQHKTHSHTDIKDLKICLNKISALEIHAWTKPKLHPRYAKKTQENH